MEVIDGGTASDLRDFLRRLLGALAGIPWDSVPDLIDLDQLTSDVDLIIKA